MAACKNLPAEQNAVSQAVAQSAKSAIRGRLHCRSPRRSGLWARSTITFKGRIQPNALQDKYFSREQSFAFEGVRSILRASSRIVRRSLAAPFQPSRCRRPSTLG